MRLKTILLLSLALVAPTVSASVPASLSDLSTEVDETIEEILSQAPGGVRFVVGFHEMPDVSSGEYAGARVVDLDETLRFVTVEVTDRETFEARVTLDQNVRYHELEGTVQAFWTPNDPFYGTSDYQWGAKKIFANLAWDKTRGSTGVKLCIIDSGLYKSHEEFAGLGRVAQGYDFVFEDTDPNDPNGHGTHVAGIASAQEGNSKGIAGIAKVTLVPVRVLDGAGSGTVTDVAQGFRYARDIGCHIASASLGGGASTTIQDAVVYAQNGGVLVIAATGNDGCACMSYPAGYSGVLGVGATDKNNAKATFSNTGSHVDLVAPGVAIVSTYKTISGCTTNCYVYLDGTSMATPYVSGVAALVKSYNAGLTASQIQSRLTGTAQDLGTAGRDNSFGYGLVRADAAVY